MLGLIVEIADEYVVSSNREKRKGNYVPLGRYDIMLEPRALNHCNRDAMIIEFKVQDSEEEPELSDTVEKALEQIKRKNYEAALVEKGIPGERIRKYGFAFCGKQVLIGKAP